MKRQFKFTKKAFDALQPEPGVREVEYSDVDVPGLRIIVNRLGRKAWLLRYTLSGVKRAMKLGDYPAVDINEARLKAIEARALIGRGIDPYQPKVVEVAAKPMTLTEFMEQHYLPHAQSLRSFRDVRSRWVHHLKPAFGNTALVDLRIQDIQRFHDRKKVERCPATANRLLALLKRALNLAMLWDVGGLQKSPLRGIRMHQENNHRQRYLSGDELKRFMAALDREPNRTAAAAIKFLLATGTRRMEGLTARFSDINLENATWVLTKTKNGKSRVVYLNEVAINIIKEQQARTDSPWVFPSPTKKGAHMADPKKAFKRILADAGIDGIVLHSLRHTYATTVAALYPLHITSKLLGHSSVTVTAEYYAHAQPGQMREAVASMSDAMIGNAK